MQPTTHVLVGIVVVAAVVFLRERRLPGWRLMAITAFASVLPDVVDKPLAWTFAVMPSGRAGLHSLPVALPLVALVLLVTYRRDRLGYGLAFAWGYLAHVVTDFRRVLTAGPEGYYESNLLWPLVRVESGRDASFMTYFPTLDPLFVLELVGIALLVGYLVFDFRRREAQSQQP